MDNSNSYKVCFVCTGNACRSPFAECVTRKLLAQQGVENIDVFSLGTSDWGSNPRDAVMVEVAAEMGYELVGTTTPMTRPALAQASLIVVFSQAHRDAITRLLDYGLWDRVVLFNRVAFGKDGDVEDPHFQTVAVYRRVAKHIEDGCKILVEGWRDGLVRP